MPYSFASVGRKTLHAELRKHLGVVFRGLALQKQASCAMCMSGVRVHGKGSATSCISGLADVSYPPSDETRIYDYIRRQEQEADEYVALAATFRWPPTIRQPL